MRSDPSVGRSKRRPGVVVVERRDVDLSEVSESDPDVGPAVGADGYRAIRGGTLRDILDAETLMTRGESERAATALAAVVERSDFVNPRALARLAELAVDARSRDTAIAALLPTLEQDLGPALRFRVAAKLGVGLGRAGRYPEAMRAFEIAARLDPDNEEVQRGLATARSLAEASP